MDEPLKTSATAREERVRELCRRPAIRKLDEILREQTGVGLVILLPQENEKLEVCSAGEPAILPQFCRVIHSAPGGLGRCITCRSNLAFAAFNRGLVQHACHGGVSVLAAPVTSMEEGRADIIVVASCAFTPRNRAAGWTRARQHAKGLALDVGALRRAYYQLPSLTSSKRTLVRNLVDLAAKILTDEMALQAQPPAGKTPPRSRLDEAVREALILSPKRAFQSAKQPNGATLIEVVSAVVRSKPNLPFRVSEIARAAGLTPNHFSALFRKHVGQSFSTFLTAMRVAMAQELLRDLKLSVQEVSARAGFDDPNYFARRFKQKTGLTPRAWRAAL
jgi:AraC-like DNA-binding protein